MAMFKFSAIRNLKGETYFIDCCDLFKPELRKLFGMQPYELMVFKSGVHREDAEGMGHDNSIATDREFTQSIDWRDLYVERYETPEDALEGFKRVVANLKDYIPSD